MKQADQFRKSAATHTLVQSRNRLPEQLAKENTKSFFEAEFETDKAITQGQPRLVDEHRGIGDHLVFVDNLDRDLQAFNCVVSKQLESRFLGTDEKSISLQAHDFDLSNTIHTKNSLLEEMNEDSQAILQ